MSFLFKTTGNQAFSNDGSFFISLRLKISVPKIFTNLESTLKYAKSGAISKINSLLPPIRIESNFECRVCFSVYLKNRFSFIRRSK